MKKATLAALAPSLLLALAAWGLQPAPPEDTLRTASSPAEVLGPEIDTPILLGLRRVAPHMHDGSAATLLDVISTANLDEQHGVTSHLTEIQLDVWSRLC